MKALLLTIALAATPAVAKEEATKQDICDAYGKVAEAIMTARQGGVSMSKSMALADDNNLVKSLVIEAYEQPAYSTESVKKKTIRDFADNFLLVCYKEIQNG